MKTGISRRLLMLLLFFHSISAVVVSATDMPVAAKAAAFTLILASLIFHLARDILRLLPSSWLTISLGSDGVSVTTFGGGSFTGQFEKVTVVSPCLVVLSIRPEGSRLPVSRLIFSDALEGSFRELCVRLRFA